MRTIILSVIILSLTLGAFSQEERKMIREGNKLYENKQFDEAAYKFEKAYEKNPDEYKLLNNIGASQYRNGLFNESAMSYENLLKMSGTKKEKADAFYNIGNSYLQAADYQKSIEAYRNALRLDPEHDLSRYNMAVATKIQEQQQQQQDQQQQQGDGDGENNQDQQDKQDGDKKEEQNQDNENNQNEDKKENEQNQPEPKDNEMSREEMERFLESLQQQEKDVQEKVKKEKFKTQQRIVEKEW